MYSSIQVWSANEAPDWLLRLVNNEERYDWVAFVPEALNDQDVIGLLVTNRGETSMELKHLADGSALLAGQFGHNVTHARTTLSRRISGRDRSRSLVH